MPIQQSPSVTCFDPIQHNQYLLFGIRKSIVKEEEKGCLCICSATISCICSCVCQTIRPWGTSPSTAAVYDMLAGYGHSTKRKLCSVTILSAGMESSICRVSEKCEYNIPQCSACCDDYSYLQAFASAWASSQGKATEVQGLRGALIMLQHFQRFTIDDATLFHFISR